MARGRRARRFRVSFPHRRRAGRLCASFSHGRRSSGGGEDDEGHSADIVAVFVHELEDVLLGLDNLSEFGHRAHCRPTA